MPKDAIGFSIMIEHQLKQTLILDDLGVIRLAIHCISLPGHKLWHDDGVVLGWVEYVRPDLGKHHDRSRFNENSQKQRGIIFCVY